MDNVNMFIMESTQKETGLFVINIFEFNNDNQFNIL